MMVGNSLRSDVLPVAALGGNAVHVPYSLTWTHETEIPEGIKHLPYHRLDRIDQLPDLIQRHHEP